MPDFVPDIEVAREVVSGSAWTYLAVTGIVALDCVLPVAPGETVVITAGIFATSGELFIGLVLLAAFVGSLVGDNASYGLGTTIGCRAERRLGRRWGSFDARVRWARRQLDVRGGVIIVVARFIPGGRTATTFTSGTVAFPWRARFLPLDALAAAIWAIYAAGLGYVGGQTFSDDLLLALGLSFVVAAILTGVGEVVRRLLDR